MTDMLTQIRSLGDQLRWAGDREAPSIGTHSEILFAGMGGSGIAGNYIGVVAAPHGTRVTVNKGYGPVPLWAIRQRPLVVAASYSGNTEETLDFVLAAHESGLPVATITTGGQLAEMSESHSWPVVHVPGGLQPRAAIGYLLGAAIKLLEGSHSIDDQRLSLVEAADFVDQALQEGSNQWQTAREIADSLKGRFPIVYGGGRLSSVVAKRWKTQINENAKRPAWYASLPELDHNEIVGWESMAESTRESFGVVALTDSADHDRIASRLAHTRNLTEDAVPWVGRVSSHGTSALTRLMSLTVVGDLVSWMLADSAGIDPVPVETIEKLKQLLTEEDQ
jgi:glucose/mannose-6-phosphate isomerase